jgi:hypothetical protein
MLDARLRMLDRRWQVAADPQVGTNVARVIRVVLNDQIERRTFVADEVASEVLMNLIQPKSELRFEVRERLEYAREPPPVTRV